MMISKNSSKVSIHREKTFHSPRKNESQTEKYRFFPIFKATFDFVLLIAPKVSNGFSSNVANMCVAKKSLTI